jgi:flagellar motility protein MotE (MotC chaperone)
MTKIFVACLVLFPVMFVGMLVVTGTIEDLLPIVEQEVKRVVGREPVDAAPSVPGFDVVDSLIVADLERREASIEASLDSLEVMRDRMTTERQELERLGRNVEQVIAELRDLEERLSAQRDKERKSLARIFGEMDPERAADILALLTEDDVEFLVKSMKQRQAAEVLAMLSPGVAARVSERILNSPADVRPEIGP